MTYQPDLFTRIPTKRREIEISLAEKDKMLACLRFAPHGGWLLTADITAQTGLDARKVRAISEQTGEVIHGQDGLKHIINASDAEVETCLADLQSRKDAYDKRMAKIIKNWKGRRT